MSSNTATPIAETLIAEFPKNNREVVRIRLTEYQGAALVDVRAFYLHEGERKPGKGICLRREQIPLLRKALADAEKASRQTAPTAEHGA